VKTLFLLFHFESESTWGATALRGMYESALVFISNLKQKNLYIVSCVQCDIWEITAYFILQELKYHYEK